MGRLTTEPRTSLVTPRCPHLNAQEIGHLRVGGSLASVLGARLNMRAPQAGDQWKGTCLSNMFKKRERPKYSSNRPKYSFNR